MTPHRWHLPDRTLTIGRRPLVLGVVNVTPDSFSDGGRLATSEAAVAYGLELVRQGADLLDVGGESTRPGARPVLPDEELARVLPVVRGLAGRAGVPVSVDTSKAEVARQCLAAGASVINDVTALGDPAMSRVVRDAGAAVILMHMQGTPATMQDDPRYGDVVAEVGRFLEARLHDLAAAGIPPERVAVDPGIGFGKTLDHNLQLLAGLGGFQRLGRPVVLGVSRKGFLGRLLGGRPVDDRLAAGLAVACHAQARGAVQVVRVHDVRATADALAVCAAIDGADSG
jgi:dihydropteroate synthase